jgi:plasmid maintenance system killer protein
VDFFGGENVRQFASFKKLAERKLVMLDSAVTLGGLAASPGNKLEKLLGDRAGQYSIRINGQGGFVLLGKTTVRMTSKLWTIIKE